MNKMKVLAIGAHPDDIEIYMFGFISACYERKDNIFLAIATDGAAGILGKYKNIVSIRSAETKKALAKFGDPFLMGFPDGKLIDSENVRIQISDYIRKIEPDLILTHDPYDYHPDHRTLSKLVTDAAGFLCPVLFSDTLMGVNFKPDYYVDITNYFNDKKKAILEHKSQDPIKFFEATEILNRFRSAQCNSPKGNYAEAYRLQNMFPSPDIRSILPPSPPISPFYRSLHKSLI